MEIEAKTPAIVEAVKFESKHLIEGFFWKYYILSHDKSIFSLNISYEPHNTRENPKFLNISAFYA